MIPSNRTRRIIIPHDGDAYKQRNRIERCFYQLKHFRRFATRYDRGTANFTGFIHLAAAMIWMQGMSIGPRPQVVEKPLVRFEYRAHGADVIRTVRHAHAHVNRQ